MDPIIPHKPAQSTHLYNFQRWEDSFCSHEPYFSLCQGGKRELLVPHQVVLLTSVTNIFYFAGRSPEPLDPIVDVYKSTT